MKWINITDNACLLSEAGPYLVFPLYYRGAGLCGSVEREVMMKWISFIFEINSPFYLRVKFHFLSLHVCYVHTHAPGVNL